MKYTEHIHAPKEMNHFDFNDDVSCSAASRTKSMIICCSLLDELQTFRPVLVLLKEYKPLFNITMSVF